MAPRAFIPISALAALLLAGAIVAPVAAADPLLDQKQQEYRQVQEQVHLLDERAERLTEQYDRAAWKLGQLRIRIADATRRLDAAERRLTAERAQLRRRQQALGRLIVADYKGGDVAALDIVLGSSTLSQLTGGIDLQRRVDASLHDAVVAVHAAVARVRATRDAIAAERATLERSRRQVEAQERVLARRRVQIRHELARRRAIMAGVGAQVRLLEAASSVNQSAVALAAQGWLLSDERVNRDDPGAVIGDQVAIAALNELGVPYVWGGASPGGFDCSGLTMWLWAGQGVTLPHFAAAQYNLGPQVARDQLRPGDLVFFHKLGHVAVYIGDGYVVHAPHTGSSVRIESLSTPWFEQTYVGATRPGPA